MRYALFQLLLALVVGLMTPGCGAGDVPLGPGGVLLVAPAPGDPATDRIVAQTEVYLRQLSGHPPGVWRPLKAPDRAALAAKAAQRQAGLVVGLDLGGSAFAVASTCALKGDAFRIETWRGGDHDNRLGSQGSSFVVSTSVSVLGRNYAAYELLRRLGARFYHPEQEYVPHNRLEDLRERAETPTILARQADGVASECYAPDFTHRGFTYHGAHPLEVREALSDSAHDFGEAERLIDWSIKNRSNSFIGGRKGVAPQARYAERAAQLNALRDLLKFPVGTGITLHNEQQGASAAIDPTLATPVRDQIEAIVAQRVGSQPPGTFESFNIHYGKTEFTTTPDKETVQWINWAGAKALELDPAIIVEVNNHTTGGQPMPNFDDLGCPSGTNFDNRIDYYDLAWHTDPRFGIKVHTVMFYPLEGPAHVYDQISFAHKLCLMKQGSAAGRPLTWFPEGSWWLSFDNPIPVYLPLYIKTRHRDIELVRPLLASRGSGTVRGHRMFDSGHEWGYWQQDYTVGLWHWSADVSLDDATGELFDALCAPKDWKTGCAAKTEAVAVLKAVMVLQQTELIDAKDWQGLAGGRYAYFAGEDPADEIAAVTGFEFRPVRVAFTQINRWELDEILHFRQTDLAALKAIDIAHAAHLQRLVTLRTQIPAAGAVWLEEVIDGVQINQLRAAQAYALYNTVLTFRELTVKKEITTDPTKIPDPLAAAETLFKTAAETLAAARLVISKREAAYRYPPEQTHGGGLTPATAKPNGTTYPWRVHTKTHLMTYWNNRHQQVRDLLDGKGSSAAGSLRVAPAFAAPGVKATLVWPPLPGLTAKVSLGDGTDVGTETTTHTWTQSAGKDPTAGAWRIDGTLTTEGREVPVAGAVVRGKVISVSKSKAFTLTKPTSPLAQGVLGQLWPAFQWAFVDAVGDQATAALCLGPDVDGDGQVWFGDVSVAPLASQVSDTFATAPFDLSLPVPDPATGQEALRLRIAQVVLTGTREADGSLLKVTLSGGIVLEDLVKALMDLAGFDQPGALKTLSGVLGFDAAKPPETVPVAGDIAFGP